jgi:hypothetical protein
MGPSWTATWADLKQLAWAIALLWGLIAVLAVLTRSYFGPAVIPVAIGLAGFVAVAFALITAGSLLVSVAADVARRTRARWARRHHLRR